MSYFNYFWHGARDPHNEHEKAWKRAEATAWDAKWQALSVAARTAYLTQIKAPNKEKSFTQPSTPLDKVPADAVAELEAAGFVKVNPPVGKKPGRVFPLSAAFDFSSRLRSIHRYHLLGPTNRENLTKYVKHAFYNQGETIINRVLAKAEIQDQCRLDEGLELYVTTRRWPDWALQTIESKAARPLLDALRTAGGPVAIADLPKLVKGATEADIRGALTDLVVNLVAFEDLRDRTLELEVGLLPIVREKMAGAEKARTRPPLVVVETPKEAGPPGGLMVNDLRTFLLEVAGESPRLRQDGGIFQKEEPRFLAALAPWPSWLDAVLHASPEGRLQVAYRNSQTFGFVEVEAEEKATWLRLSGKGRSWLASGLEEQYVKLYDALRPSPRKGERYSYDHDTGDSKFLGIGVVAVESGKGPSSYYYGYMEPKPEHRQALREAIRKAFEEMPVGVFHRWDSVLDHLAFGDHNPLTSWLDPAKTTIYLDQRPVPRLPERQEEAGKKLLEVMIRGRLLPFDAFRAAVDDQGRVCVARLPRFEGYFGRPYESGEDAAAEATRVIVQPDFSVVVIGMNPAPAAELAPFCERAGGQAGHGVMTFKITRDAVIRATSQGLAGSAILARLRKHASVNVPENVLREVREWADWVRMVNVRPITVVRCPDSETVARVVSALGKKAERLSDTLVALHASKLTPAERLKLQEQGVIVTKEDITPTPTTLTPAPATSPAPAPSTDGTAPTPKKRGRPKKAR